MNNIKIIILLCLVFNQFFASIGWAQEKHGFTITGKIKGLKEGETVKLTFEDTWPIWGNGWTKPVASALVKNGKFTIRGYLPDGPRLAELEFSRTNADMKQPFPPFLMDNENIVIHGRVRAKILPSQSIIIEGSRSNEERKKLFPYFDIWRQGLRDRLTDTLQKLNGLLGYNKDFMAGIERLKLEQLAQVKRGLVQNSSGQAAVPYYVMQCFDAVGHDSIVSLLYDRLDEHIKTSYYGKLMQNRLYLCEGQPAPNFTSFTPEGKSVSLKDVTAKNKLTILDFWGSGCIPCRNEFKEYTVALYNEFHNKGLEIIAVSWDKNEKSWKKAITDDQQPWINVSSLKGFGDSVYSSYKIIHTPQNVVIDQQGKIVAWNISGLELHWFVDKYLNK
ncbi:TlpA disulfide reductase family protein [Mucilaginibacter ginsenosidivorans]|uniref:AhpC/TSA family protein n=1 Tax=Mucilaginibacter ginsenosidivorans TaxID=398053 RepID=A0A5B8UVH0_9SPHI|nr:TlpA disulfide reductase family protein [Mucilaginibacter ginsenosidivorans]QEC62436.1 AhpC/TSA family protein [Mucilaginibacter ginsenosidivorans]